MKSETTRLFRSLTGSEKMNCACGCNKEIPKGRGVVFIIGHGSRKSKVNTTKKVGRRIDSMLMTIENGTLEEYHNKKGHKVQVRFCDRCGARMKAETCDCNNNINIPRRRYSHEPCDESRGMG